MPVQFLGIYREKRFSPGAHAAGDAEILELTQAALERAGYQTTLIAPESLPTMSPSAPVVFSMCQSLEALAVLQTWEHQGVLVLNTPAAVHACYRLALVTALSQTTLPFPRSVSHPPGQDGANGGALSCFAREHRRVVGQTWRCACHAVRRCAVCTPRHRPASAVGPSAPARY